jgi:hypothetical protein
MVEHDDALIRNWNETVGPDDEVWHLGDFMSARGIRNAGAVVRGRQCGDGARSPAGGMSIFAMLTWWVKATAIT